MQNQPREPFSPGSWKRGEIMAAMIYIIPHQQPTNP